MSITDELREFARGCAGGMGGDALCHIADRIDAEHEANVSTACRLAAGLDNDALAKRGYVKLPVDADGVPIRLGDELTNGEDMPAKVRSMMLIEEGWMVSSQPRPGLTVAPNILRHVRPDTWERIIEDAISESGWEQPKDYEIYYEDSKETRDRFVAELVERCRRLAGEAQ